MTPACRLLLTAVAVLLGMTFVSGGLVLMTSSQAVLGEQFRTVTGGADLAVRRVAVVDAAMGMEATGDPVPPSVLATIRSVPGVAQVQPVSRGQGLLTVGPRAVMPSGASLLESWSPSPFNPYQLRVGRGPAADDEVVLDLSTALTQRIRLGDTVGVQGPHSATFRVVGLVGSGRGQGPSNSRVALVPLPAAQRLLGLGVGASDAEVRAVDGTGIEALRSRLGAALGTKYQVSSSQDVARSAGAARTGLGITVAAGPRWLDASTVPLALGGILLLAAMVVAGPAVVGPLLRTAGRSASWRCCRRP